MDKNKKRIRLKRRINKALLAVLSLIIVVACAFGTAGVITYLTNDKTGGDSSSTDTVSQTSSGPEKITEIATATVAVTGDLLIHDDIITGAYNKETKLYDFNNVFEFFGKYVSQADYSIANLETTFRGTEDGKVYKGYPLFNCPDALADAVKANGFDMLLTANNHSYDTFLKGFDRTIQVISDKGLDVLGTQPDETTKKYVVKDINGIKIGMTCFTYQTGDGKNGTVYLNGIKVADEAAGRVNAFSYSRLNDFYAEIEKQIKDMKSEGAEATVLYIHWGTEYKLKETKQQQQMAQKLCNLGIDVIVGGHPHVIEPVDMLTSETDEKHKTVVVYSLANALSNQRTARNGLSKGYTEDGMLFSYTFSKYSDGTVMLKDINLMPTWVNRYEDKTLGKPVFQIMPLDISIKDNWKTEFRVNDNTFKQLENSYKRTMDIVGEGLNSAKTYLANQITPDMEEYGKEPSSSISSTTLEVAIEVQ